MDKPSIRKHIRTFRETSIWRIFGFLRAAKRTVAIASAIVVLRVLAETAAVYFLSPAVTEIARISTNPTSAKSVFEWLADEQTADLRRVLMYTVTAQIVFGGLIFFRQVWDAKLSMRVVFHLRGLVYDRLQTLDFSFHDRMTSSKLINRALSDLQAVRGFLNTVVLQGLEIFVTVAAYLGLLLYVSPWIGLAFCPFLPLWWTVIARFNIRAKPLYEQQQHALDKMMTIVTETIAGVQVVRAFGAEKVESEKYAEANAVLLGRVTGLVNLIRWLTPGLRFIASLAHIVLFVIACVFIQSGEISVGDLVILGVAMTAIVAKLQQLNLIVDGFQKAKVSAARLFEVLDTVPAMPEHNTNLEVTKGEVTFESVSFSYGASRALTDVSVRIGGGRITAIAGATGAGKSTFAALVARFYDPIQGRVFIDGQDLRGLSPSSVRSAVGFVFQETVLFSDTIKNNIKYGREDVDDSMVIKAAIAAQASEFIEHLPLGYETMIGEKGIQLSGGQKQRIALARALVYDPRVLILDDATAALDATTETRVHTSVRPFLHGRTVILIAHRLSTLRLADKIVVLDRGRLVQYGTHDELIAHDGVYKDLVFMQMLHRPLELSKQKQISGVPPPRRVPPLDGARQSG